MIADRARFDAAIACIDAANAEDPNSEAANGQTHPKELLYGKRMSGMAGSPCAQRRQRLCSLAARAQHIRRWTIARRDYPMTRAGYLKWRTTLYRFPRRRRGQGILRDVGYDGATISAVASLLRKERLRTRHTTHSAWKTSRVSCILRKPSCRIRPSIRPTEGTEHPAQDVEEDDPEAGSRQRSRLHLAAGGSHPSGRGAFAAL